LPKYFIVSGTFCGGALEFNAISLVLKGKDHGYCLSFETGVTFPSGPVTLVTVPTGAGENRTGYLFFCNQYNYRPDFQSC
jgi:hypothetical protein